ncbi:MAG TPA: AAC(3) family N-acetyltransferase [Armatimonadota bacterium]|nr:AAC(3) family N-acetyltransferase [Armatimonadota bacterium]
MRPEAGDKSVQVSQEDVAEAARSVGIQPGDTVMFHSSLSSMGTVVGGPDAVIDGFLDAVGPEGTVAVPTLCNWQPDEQHLVFERWDPATSPSYVGVITETLRKRPEAFRSDHATHSVAAIGRRARELTADHGALGERQGHFGGRAFAHVSPWQRFVDWNAAYCFIGVSFRVNTMVHYVESVLAERALERADPDRREQLAREIAGWMKPGVYPGIRIEDREEIERMLAEEGVMRYGPIGSAALRCCRARPMVERWVAIFEADPGRWLSEEFVLWSRRIAGGGAS